MNNLSTQFIDTTNGGRRDTSDASNDAANTSTSANTTGTDAITRSTDSYIHGVGIVTVLAIGGCTFYAYNKKSSQTWNK